MNSFKKEKQPLVSIVMPCYNAELFINSAIKSVIAQDYSNWELLIVDDGSTDKSLDIIKKFADNDCRIKYYKNKRASGSPSEPRNIALDKAMGRYIAFLDSDDLWFPSKLTNQISCFKKHDSVIVYSNYERINEEGVRSDRVISFRPLHTFASLLKGNDIVCSSAIIDIEAIGEKLFFKEIGHEDYEYWLRILKRGFSASNCGTTEVLYRIRKNSVSSNPIDALSWLWNIHFNELDLSMKTSIINIVHHIIKSFIKDIKQFTKHE